MPPPSSPSSSDSRFASDRNTIAPLSISESTTRALLSTLEDLRDTLSARVDQLGRSVERLRLQADELERSLESVGVSDAEETTPLLPGSMDVSQTEAGMPSSRRNVAANPSAQLVTSIALPRSPPRVTVPPTHADNPSSTQNNQLPSLTTRLRSSASPTSTTATTHPTSSAIATELQTLSRPITNVEIGALLDRASQSVSTSAAAPAINPNASTTSTVSSVTNSLGYSEVLMYLQRLNERAQRLRQRAEEHSTSSEADITLWNDDILELARGLRRAQTAFQRLEETSEQDTSQRERDVSAVNQHRNAARRSLVEAASVAHQNGHVPREIGRRIVEAMRGTETQAERDHMDAAGAERRRANGTARLPVHLRGLPPTNVFEVRNHPDPVVIRSIPASPASTVKAEPRNDQSRRSPARSNGPAAPRAGDIPSGQGSSRLTTQRPSVNPAQSPAPRSDADINFGSAVAGLLAAARRQPRIDGDSSLTTRGHTVANRIARDATPQIQPNASRQQALASILTQDPGERAIVTQAGQQAQNLRRGAMPTLSRTITAGRARDIRSLAREIANTHTQLHEEYTDEHGPASNLRTEVVVQVGVMQTTRPADRRDANAPDDLPSDPVMAIGATGDYERRLLQMAQSMSPTPAALRRENRPPPLAPSANLPDNEQFNAELDETLNIARRLRNRNRAGLSDEGDGPTPSSPTISRPRSDSPNVIIDTENNVLIFTPSVGSGEPRMNSSGQMFVVPSDNGIIHTRVWQNVMRPSGVPADDERRVRYAEIVAERVRAHTLEQIQQGHRPWPRRELARARLDALWRLGPEGTSVGRLFDNPREAESMANEHQAELMDMFERDATSDELIARLDASAARLRRTRDRLRSGQSLLQQIGDLRAELNLGSDRAEDRPEREVNPNIILDSWEQVIPSFAVAAAPRDRSPEDVEQVEMPIVRPIPEVWYSGYQEDDREDDDDGDDNDDDHDDNDDDDDDEDDDNEHNSDDTENEITTARRTISTNLRSASASVNRLERTLLDALAASGAEPHRGNEMPLEGVGSMVDRLSPIRRRTHVAASPVEPGTRAANTPAAAARQTRKEKEEEREKEHKSDGAPGTIEDGPLRLGLDWPGPFAYTLGASAVDVGMGGRVYRGLGEI